LNELIRIHFTNENISNFDSIGENNFLETNEDD